MNRGKLSAHLAHLERGLEHALEPPPRPARPAPAPGKRERVRLPIAVADISTISVAGRQVLVATARKRRLR